MGIHVPKNTVARLIRERAGELKCPAGVDALQLLWALAGNESDFGRDCGPRHEDSYCPNTKGRYATAIGELTKQWGCLAHMSYGPWQVMFCNTEGVSPFDLAMDAETGLIAAIQHLNQRVFRQGAQTLDQIADAYNTGSYKQGVPPAKYIENLKRRYDMPVPLAPSAGAGTEGVSDEQ